MLTRFKTGGGVRPVVAAALAIGVLGLASEAYAGPIVVKDFGDIDTDGDGDLSDETTSYTLINSVSSTVLSNTSNFVPLNTLLASVEGEVWQEDVAGDYIYITRVTPDADLDFDDWTAAFEIIKPAGRAATDFAGYDVDEANAAGISFSVVQSDVLGIITWNRDSAGGGAATGVWNVGETITFFFRDPRAPSIDTYLLQDGDQGDTANVAPVPEPSTLALLGLGILGLAGVARRRKRKAAPAEAQA